MPAPVLALLGPTNTGKTHHAMERLLQHRTGMIGFPLRLLARENYDRLVALRGPEAVALVTGEERLLPRSPSYFVCTVEAMPLDRRVDFLAVDEVQLAADRERGHVFTDRIVHARGLEETMLLGAETIRPLLRLLAPEAEVIRRPRLSTLTYAEPRKITRLPRRTAIVAFSLAELYALAERVRREAGGAALVFGALSPRTRNAQVALYQAGEVDYLVATDAIGMGLNLDIDHVAFTAIGKFDGRGTRPLRPAEVAQIAGRAGRHLRDGTFGATADLGPFDRGLVDAIEAHRFEPLDAVFWRNTELDFRSPPALLASLERPAPDKRLVRMSGADDHRALAVLTQDPGTAALARRPEDVQLLWEVCQVPDFRNVMSEAHTVLLARIYRHLTEAPGRLPEDWVELQVSALDSVEGGIDALLGRISGIRTWTYVSHRAGWLSDPRHWQERTRAVEDRLSDALHERLTQQFVERRTSVVGPVAADGLVAEIAEDGILTVQGVIAGRLEGFRFSPAAGASRAVLSAANRALRAGLGERVACFVAEADQAFTLGPEGRLAWRQAPVARLVAGEEALAPRVDVLPSDLLVPAMREAVRRRLAAFVEAHLGAGLGPLLRLRSASLSGAARGLAFSLAGALGSVPRRRVAPLLRDLSAGDRRALAGLGVWIGRRQVFLTGLFDRQALRLRGLLWSLHRGGPGAPILDGRPSAPADARVAREAYAACGYEVLGPLAVRVDRLERLLAAAHRRGRGEPFVPDDDLRSLAGCGLEDLAAVLRAAGFRRADGGKLAPPARARSRAGSRNG
jgi:ATP-dependent RNA helicase SUPV3L1/SUV3